MHTFAAAAILLFAPLAAGQAALRTGPSDDTAARLAALDPAGRLLRATSTADDGTLRRLAGPLELQGATLDERAADFAARFAPLFGADATATLGAPRPLQPRADGSPRYALLPQVVHGAEVEGAGVTLALDEEARAIGAHGRVSAAAAALAPPAAEPAAAAAIALAHLGVQPADLTGEPATRLVAHAGTADAVLLWRVTLVERAGLSPWRVDVDAHSGAVLSARPDRCTGIGTIDLDGALVEFDASGAGSGNAYKTVGKALVEAQSGVSLTDMLLDDLDVDYFVIAGTLTGRYCTVADFDAVLFSPIFDFPFNDSGATLVDGTIPEAQAFDHVNAYYWITRTAKYLTKVTGTLPSNICIPTYVNFHYDEFGNPEPYKNAFYSPTDPDGPENFGDGFFVFGDFDIETGDLMDDVSRDPTVVSHEYFHGMSDFAGLTFGDDALDTPPRAVNEAIADYGATSFHKDPALGAVLAFHSGEDFDPPIINPYLRNLSLPLVVDDNLFDTVNPETDLPEEHEAGEIFGAALWRLRQNAKQKAADDLVINNLAAWPQTVAELGFDPVTPANAEDAYEAYYFECFLSLLESALAPGGAKGWKQAGHVLGAFLAHGIADDDGTIVALPTEDAKASFKVASAFLGSLTEHSFALDLLAGQPLTVTLTGDKDDATQVDFDFPDAAPGDLEFPFDKTVNATGTKVSQKNITVVAPGSLVLRFTTASGPGAYKAMVKVKPAP
jgi:hypothetical protein